MFSDDTVIRGGQLPKPGADFLKAWIAGAQTGIAQSNAGVPDQASPFRALYRTAPEKFAKFLFCERDEPFQIRRKKRMLRSAARFKTGERSHRGAAVPRTHVLANITSKNVPPHRLPPPHRTCGPPLHSA